MPFVANKSVSTVIGLEGQVIEQEINFVRLGAKLVSNTTENAIVNFKTLLKYIQLFSTIWPNDNDVVNIPQPKCRFVGTFTKNVILK